MSSRRIVLFEESGEIVFEGVSVLDEKAEEHEHENADSCPPTQRSPQSDSGFFPVIPRAKGERAA